MPRFTLVVLLPLLVGCGLEDYEARMTNRLAELQEMTRYESLYGATPIDIVVDDESVPYPITIRLPKLFGISDWFRVGSRYRNERVVEPHVLYPPFLLEFPGFNRVGEAFAEATPQTHFSFYCYLGVLDSRAAKFEAVLADLRKKTAAKLPQTGPWQDVECRDENLVATKWKMFEAKGKQKFAQKSGGIPETTLDAMGTFRVYARVDQGYIVLWAVRMPDELNGKVYLLDLADAVAGTVKVTEPAPTGPYVPPQPKPKVPDGDMPPTDETPTDETPAEETPGQETPASDKPAVKPPAGEAPVDEGPWSDPKNDQAPPEEPATDQPPPEDADPADSTNPGDEAAPEEMPDAAMEESGAESSDEQSS